MDTDSRVSLDEADSRTCCCRTQNAIVVIGILTLVFSLVTTATLSHNLALESDEMFRHLQVHAADQDHVNDIVRTSRWLIIVLLLLSLTMIFASIALLWAIKKQKPGYAVPWIIGSLLTIAANDISTIILITKLWQSISRGAIIGAIAGIIVMYLPWTYCVAVVYKFHRRNRRKHSSCDPPPISFDARQAAGIYDTSPNLHPDLRSVPPPPYTPTAPPFSLVDNRAIIVQSAFDTPAAAPPPPRYSDTDT